MLSVSQKSQELMTVTEVILVTECPMPTCVGSAVTLSDDSIAAFAMLVLSFCGMSVCIIVYVCLFEHVCVSSHMGGAHVVFPQAVKSLVNEENLK